MPTTPQSTSSPKITPPSKRGHVSTSPNLSAKLTAAIEKFYKSTIVPLADLSMKSNATEFVFRYDRSCVSAISILNMHVAAVHRMQIVNKVTVSEELSHPVVLCKKDANTEQI